MPSILPAVRVTVTTAATQLDQASATDLGCIVVRNRGSVSVFLGAAGVTAAAGYELSAGESMAIDMTGPEGARGGAQAQMGLYGITASSTAVVHVLQVDR